MATHHASTMSSLPSDTMRPHAGVGLGMPAPRKLSVASSRMTWPISSVPSTITVLTTLGKMCRTMIRKLEAPATRARATKSWALMLKVSPRTMRA